MLPAVHLRNNNVPAVNIPAVQVLTVPAWDVWSGYETFNATSEEYQVEDAADNFKALARRNGIKVSRPAEETAENHGAAANLSPTATEFVPRNTPPPEVIPENLQLAAFLQPFSNPVTVTSPLNEDKKLLEMFQEVLNEKRQQFRTLQECIKDRDESKAKINSLTQEKTALKEEIEELTEIKERNSMLSEEVEALTERLIEFERNNSRLKLQVAALAHKLQEDESRNDSVETRAARLEDELHQNQLDKERLETEICDLKSQLKESKHYSERLETEICDLKCQLKESKRDSERLAAEICDLKCQLKESKRDNERLETEICDLKCQLKESKRDNEREKEPASTSSKKKMDSLDCIVAVDDDDSNWTVVQRKTKGAKLSHSCKFQNDGKKVKAKRSQSLDDALLDLYNGLPFSDKKNEQREKKTALPLMPGGQDSHADSCASSPLNKAKRSSVNADVPRNNSVTAEHEAFEICDAVTPTKVDVVAPAQDQPMKLVKPAGQVIITSSQTSPSSISTTNTTTGTETFIDLSFVNPLQQTLFDTGTTQFFSNTEFDSLMDQFGLPTSTSNGQEDCFSHTLFDPAIIDMSVLQKFTQPFGQSVIPPVINTTYPGMCPPLSVLSHVDSRDHTKLGSKPEKDKTKKDFTSFEILMNELAGKFPEKTRAELLILLKLAKTTFGEQGFRKKKIEEIVKRVMEIDTGSGIQEHAKE